MKKVIIVFAMLTCSLTNSQEKFEVKINPLAVIFGSPEVAGEYFFTDHLSAEIAFSAGMGKYGAISTSDYNPVKSGFGTMLKGRYYFAPEEGNDRWFLGLYMRNKSFNVKDESNNQYGEFKRNLTAAGLIVGKKWVTANNISIEAGFGLGRTLSESNEWVDENDNTDFNNFEFGIDAIGRLSVGYRF